MRIRHVGTLALSAVMLLVAATNGFGAIAQRGPRNLGRGLGPATPPPVTDRAPIQEMIEGFYVSRFQQELDLDDEHFVRLLPSLRESLERRNQLSQRHNRTLGALEQALESGASDEELTGLIQQLDDTDRQLREIQDDLLRDVDPTLSPQQRARFRIVQPNVENRIRNLIERSRNPVPARPTGR